MRQIGWLIEHIRALFKGIKIAHVIISYIPGPNISVSLVKTAAIGIAYIAGAAIKTPYVSVAGV